MLPSGVLQFGPLTGLARSTRSVMSMAIIARKTRRTLLLILGAEGGNVSLLGEIKPSGGWRFVIMVKDQTPTFLSDEDKGEAIRHRSKVISDWREALAQLDERYPHWPHLCTLSQFTQSS